MCNAKEEFLNHVGSKEVLCASMSYQDCWNHNKPTEYFKLPVDYKQEQFDHFIHLLDFEYDDGYKEWYKNGYLHREDGPAIEHPDGRKEWYINDEFIMTVDKEGKVVRRMV